MKDTKNLLDEFDRKEIVNELNEYCDKADCDLECPLHNEKLCRYPNWELVKDEMKNQCVSVLFTNEKKKKKQVFGVLGADKVPETSVNAFNYLVGRYNVIVSQELNALAASHTFFLLDSNYNSVVDGLIYQNRENLRVRAYSEEKTENIVFAGADRHCYSAIDWREIMAFNVTGGTALN